MSKKNNLINLGEGKYQYKDKMIYLVENINQLKKSETIFVNITGELSQQNYRNKYETETDEQYADYMDFILRRIENKQLFGMFYENSSGYINI